MSDIRPSSCAGQWYPAAPEELAQSVDAYIAEAKVTPPLGEVVAAVVPHAGHQYSGMVAGHAFRLVPKEVEAVALIGPSHYPYQAPVVTSAHTAYSTPLGNISVDHDALDQIHQAVPLARVRRDREHSLENELPFLQRRLAPGFLLIPLMLRNQTQALAQKLAAALAAVLQGRRALLLASSDLSHFYPQAVAHQLDRYMLGRIAAFDAAGVFEAEAAGKGYACGKGAVATVMLAAQQLGATHAEVVNYATSGDVTGDYTSVVGYGAAVAWRSEQ